MALIFGKQFSIEAESTWFVESDEILQLCSSISIRPSWLKWHSQWF